MVSGQVGPLPSDELPVSPPVALLRMLRKKAWLEPQNFVEAFVRRPDELGLSVCFDCSADNCMLISTLQKTYGAASLLASSAINLGLTVEPDAANHAEIRGIPSKEEDSNRAEYLADLLAKASTIIDRVVRQNPVAP